MQFLKTRKLLAIAGILAGMGEAWAVTKTWANNGGDWNTAVNWSPSGVPAALDDIVFNTGGTNCILSGNVAVASIIFTSGYAGDFDFAGYTLVVDGGNADFRSIGMFTTPVGSALIFRGGSNQILHPNAAYALPYIVHEGSNTLQLASNNLSSKGFLQLSGTLDLAGFDITTVAGGNFSIHNGHATSLTGLASRSITVAGVTNLFGTPAANLSLSPASGWTLASTGAILADFVTLGNCNASPSQGVAFRGTDNGGNTNWSFATNGTFYWNSNNAFTAGILNRSHNWAAGGDGSGYRPPSATDDPFTSDALGGPWSFVDNDGYAGGGYSLTARADQLEITGRGQNLDPSYNAFNGVFRSDITGDFDVTVKLLYQTPSIPQAQAGILVADDPTNLAMGGYCALTFSPAGNLVFRWDGDGSGTLEASTSVNGLTGPIWLRMVRNGTSFSAWYRTSLAGASWTQVGTSANLASAAGNSQVGLVSTAGTNSEDAFAVFDDFQGGTDFANTDFNLSFNGTGANADVNAILGVNTTVGSLDFSGFTGDFNFGSYILNVSVGNATFVAGQTVTPASGTLVFSAPSGTQTFTPKSGATYPGISKSGAGTVTVATNPLTASDLSLSAGTWDWGAGSNNHSLGSITATGGTMALGSNTVTLTSGNLALGSLGTLNAGSGTFSFTATTGTQTFTPKSGAAHPAVTKNGNGILQIATNDLACASATLSGGTWNFGTGPRTLTTTGILAVAGGTFDASTNTPTLNVGGNLSITGGTLSAGSGTLDVDGNLDMASGSGSLTCPSSNSFTIGGSFLAGASSTYTANSGTVTFNASTTGKDIANSSGENFANITFNGSGGGWTPTAHISATGTLAMTAGTLDISANARNLIVSGSYNQSGGTLTADNGSIDIDGNLVMSAGTLSAPSAGSFSVGNGFSQTGGTIAHNAGSVTLDAGSSVNFRNASSLNTVVFNGAGATWTWQASGTISTLSLSAGTLDFGTGRTITLTALTVSGGNLNFGSSTLQVSGATVNLASVGTLTPGTGYLQFNGASGQTFTPKASATHPNIIKSAAGTVTVATNNLSCGHLQVSGGTFDLSANSLDLTTSDDVQVNGGTLTMTNSNAAIGLSLDVAAGTLNAPGASKAFTVGEDLIKASGATVNHAGNLQLTATTTGRVINVAGSGFNSVSIAGSGSTWTTSAALSIAGTLTLTAGTLNLTTNGFGLTAGGLTVAGGTLTADGADIDLNGDLSITSGAFTAPVSGKTFTISGHLYRSAGTFTPGTGTIVLDGTSAGGMMDFTSAFNHLTVNGSGGTWTLSNNAISVSGTLTLTAGTLNSSTNSLNVTAGALTLNGGTLTAGNSNVDVNGSFSMTSGTITAPGSAKTFLVRDSYTQTGGTFNANGGALIFDGTGTGNTFNAAGTFNRVDFESAGEWTVATNPITTTTLSMMSGTLRLGTGLTHVVSGSTDISGGTLDFGSSTLRIAGSTVDLSSLSTLTAGTGTLEFNGSSGQAFLPKSAQTHPALKTTGSGTVTLSTYNVTTGNIDINAGTLDIGTRTLTANGNLTVAGGTLAATNGTVDVNGNLAVSSGTLTCPSGSLSVTGNLTKASGATWTHSSGTLILDGTATGKTIDIASGTLNNLTLNGAAGEWTVASNGLNVAGTFSCTNGGFEGGSSLTHSVGTIASSAPGCAFDLNTSTMNVTGNAGFGSASDVTNTGALYFTGSSGVQVFTPRSGDTHPSIGHTGASELELAGSTLICQSFTQDAGTLDFAARDITTAGSFYINNGNSSTLIGLGGRTLTVAGNAQLNGAASTSRLNANPGSAWTLAVTGTLTGSLVSLDNSNASVSAAACTNCANAGNNTNWTFAVSWDGGGGNVLWSNAANWASDYVPTSLDAVTFNATSANATLDAAADIKAITFTSGYTGTFSFSSNTLTVNSGDADFRSGGGFTAGTGTLLFNSTGSQAFYPKAGATFPAIQQSGTGGTTTVTGSNLTAGNLTITGGTFHLGAGLTHSVGTVSGSGTLHFGTSNLNASANVNFTGLTVTVPGSNVLAFTGSAAQTYTPLASVTGLSLTQNGTGGTTVSTNNFTTPALTLASGSFNLGTGRSHATGTLSSTGGSLNFGSSTLSVTGASADFSGLTSVTDGGGGLLAFTSSSAQTFTPKSGSTFPDVQQNGTGGTTVSTYGWNGGSLTVTSGTFALGSGLSHNVTTLNTTGGGLDFGSSTLEISTTDINLNPLSILTPGTGLLVLSHGSAMNLTPKSGAVHPSIRHNGSGTATVITNNLATNGLEFSNGTFAIGSRTLATTGNLVINGGTLSAASGTVDVDGNVTLSSGTLSAPSGTFTVAGSISQTGGTWTHNSGTLTLDGTATGKTLNISSTLNNLTVYGTGGGWTFGSNLTASGILTLTSGTLDLGTSLYFWFGSLNATGGTLNVNNGILRITAGDCNLSGLAGLSTGTGVIQFNAASGTQILTPKASTNHPIIDHVAAGTLQLATNDLACRAFTQSAGTFDFNGRNVTTYSGGDFTVTGGTSATFSNLSGRTITVTGNASLAGGSSSDRLGLSAASTWTLAVTGTLTASLATLERSSATVSAGACTNCANIGNNSNWTFAVTWDGGGGDNNWTTAGNWGSDYVPGSLDDVAFNGTSTKNASLDANATIRSIAFSSGYTGSFSFGSSTLVVAGGHADFRSGGSIVPGTGTLTFDLATAQNFYPKAGQTFPNILMTSTGSTTVLGAALTAGNLTLTSGTFNLGSGLAHQVAGISGSGSLDFQSSNLGAGGNVDLSGLTVTATSANTLSFTGASTQTYTPKASVTALNLTQSGSGTTTVATNDFTTPTLSLSAGTLNLGTGRTHAVTSTLSVTGGGLNVSSSTLRIAAATVNLTSLAALSHSTGSLEFTGASAQTFTPKASTYHPNLIQSGTGGTTLAGALSADALTVSSGTFTLGGGLSHQVASLSSTGGSLAFGSSTLGVSGNADLSGLASVSTGTGTLSLNASSGTQVLTLKASTTYPSVTHTGAGTLRLAGNPLSCAAFSQTQGVLDLNGQNLTTTGAFTVSNGTSSSFTGLGGRTLTVGGNAAFTGQAGNLVNLNPASAWTLAVTGTLSATLAQIMNSNASVSAGLASASVDGGSNSNWAFTLAWDGGGADNNWSTGGNWNSDAAPTASTQVVFDATSTKNCNLDGAVTVKSIAFASGYTGTFSFATNTLNVTGNADFRSGGGITAGSGTLAFAGTAAQSLIPHASSTLPGILQNGSGGTTVATNTLLAGHLQINLGAFALGSGFSHAVASIGGSGGSLDFGGSTLKVTGNADLSGLAGVTAGTGRLEFSGSGAQSFVPLSGATHPRITQTGTGTTTISTNNLTTNSLRITAGTFRLGTGLVHTASDTLLGLGGTLDFGSSTLKTAAAAPSLASLASLVPGTGTLEFNGASAQAFTPMGATTHPAILQNGAGGTTVATNGLQAGTATIAAGTLNLGTALNHVFAGLSATGGGLNFGSSTLGSPGNVNLGGLGTLTAGTGTLSFTAASGTQVFTPRNGAVHPLIVHNAAGSVQLSANPLDCLGFNQTAGAFDLNGLNLTVSSSGNLTVSGATAPLANLGGRTLTVAGNALFSGTWASRMDLDPASAWTLAVTGTLKATNVRLRNNTASVSAGLADSSVNLGGNANWTFLDTIRPADVSAFTATALSGTSVGLAWTAPPDADADSVVLRYRTDGIYPASRTDGTLWRRVRADRTTDTATGLADKTIHHFAAFVKDSAGNWSPGGTAATRDSARTPDVTPPANVTAFSADAFSATAVALAWTPTVSADADTVMIRYQTGMAFPSTQTAGILWKKLARTADRDTLTGLTANTIYAVGLFVRDSSGNYSPAAADAQDTALFQLPVTGAIVINDVSGRTRDADPALAFTWSGADSVRFSLLADTAGAAWKAVLLADSLNLGAADGPKVVAAQFKNQYGKRSLWYRDTTLVDRKAPTVTLDLKPDLGRWTWPVAVTGKSSDSLSGTDMVFVVRRRMADGFHFNGAAWQAAADTAKLVLSGNDSLFSASLPAAAMATGEYQVTAYSRDRAGNVGAPVTQAVRYEENRVPALAYSNVKDTVMQNQAVAWKLDYGDMDAGDSLIPVSFDAPAWLATAPGADTAWAPWALHENYALTGKPAQGDVGANVIRVRFQDRGGLILTHTDTVLVVDVNDAPVFADSQAAYSLKEDSVSTWTPRFEDADPGDKHTLAVLSGPAFAKVEDMSVVLKPGSRDVGPHTVIVTVSDGDLLDTLQTVLTVVNVNDKPYAFASAGFPSPAFFREDRPDSFTVVVVDLDRHEPIVFAGQMPGWMKMSMAIDSAGYNRTFTFRVTPTQKDTGLISMALTFMDPAQAVTQLALAGRILPDNDTPTAVVEDPRTHGGAARFRLSVVDEDGSLEQARFHYRLIGPTGDTVRRGITPSSLLSLHPLADGDYRFAVRAEDQDGVQQGAFTVVRFNISGATTLSLDTARWHMLGPQQALLPASLFGAGATLATWDEAGDDGQPLARYASGKTVETLKRGKGYWVRLAGPATLATAQKDLLEGPFTLKLTRAKQGWNQVANPYPYWVDLSASKLTFWEWDAEKRDLVNARGLLKPWAAYWVLASKDTTLQIDGTPYFPAPQGAVAFGGLAKSAAAGGLVAAFKHRGDWSLQLGLRAGPYHDQANRLGVRATAAAAAADQPRVLADAPKFGDYLAFHFESPSAEEPAAQGFAEDIRAVLDPEEEWWDFSVENRGTGETQALLSPAGLEGLASAGLKLFLVKQGEARLVEPGQAVTLAVEEERSHYSLVVTPHADFAGRLKGNFSISQNFPNPVTTFTAFRFVLPQSWDKDGKRVARDFKLRIKVYDYSGREVAKAVDGKFRPGTHVLRWTPATPSGRPLAKGAYIYRLETAGFVKSMKMVVK